MQNNLSLKAVGNATSLFLAINFTLCVGVSLIFHQRLMSSALQMWLPGFVWLTGPSFVLGLIESYAYGWFIAALWVPLYRFFAQSSENDCAHEKGTLSVDGLKR